MTNTATPQIPMPPPNCILHYTYHHKTAYFTRALTPQKSCDAHCKDTTKFSASMDLCHQFCVNFSNEKTFALMLNLLVQFS